MSFQCTTDSNELLGLTQTHACAVAYSLDADHVADLMIVKML